MIDLVELTKMDDVLSDTASLAAKLPWQLAQQAQLDILSARSYIATADATRELGWQRVLGAQARTLALFGHPTAVAAFKQQTGKSGAIYPGSGAIYPGHPAALTTPGPGSTALTTPGPGGSTPPVQTGTNALDFLRKYGWWLGLGGLAAWWLTRKK